MEKEENNLQTIYISNSELLVTFNQSDLNSKTFIGILQKFQIMN